MFAGMDMPTDLMGRGLRDLRVSVTDRCNFRCRYCMPVEVFGPGYAFMPREELLTFEEIAGLAASLVPLGIGKIRLTGGEPLLRRGLDDLVAMLAAVEGIHDIAITTNGVLLAHHAEALALAGLNRVTVSLDALDPVIFAKMNGVGAKVDRVLAGIQSALAFGLPVKINAVIQRGVNEGEILPLARRAKSMGVDLRFIEYMDVGETNGWKYDEVVPGEEILGMLDTEFELVPREPAYRGEVASRWQHAGETAARHPAESPDQRDPDSAKVRGESHGKIHGENHGAAYPGIAGLKRACGAWAWPPSTRSRDRRCARRPKSS